MLKNFIYQEILSEKEELVIFNAYTELALFFAGTDIANTASDFKDCVIGVFPLLDERVYPIVELAWDSLFEVNDEGIYPKKQLKKQNTSYRTYLCFKKMELSLEALVCLRIDLAHEYIADIAKIEKDNHIESIEAFDFMEDYKKMICNKIFELDEEIKSRKERHEHWNQIAFNC